MLLQCPYLILASPQSKSTFSREVVRVQSFVGIRDVFLAEMKNLKMRLWRHAGEVGFG